MTDQELEKIESTLAHHERQILDLSEMLIAQGKEIEHLRRYITKTEEKLQSFVDSAKNDAGLSPSEIAARDKPPHY